MDGYIRLFLDLIRIRPAQGGAVVESPLSGATTAAVLRYLVDGWKTMTVLAGNDYGKMMAGCAAADGPKNGNINNTRSIPRKIQ